MPKRDLDLVRTVILHVEGLDAVDGPGGYAVDDLAEEIAGEGDASVVRHHIEQLDDGGFLLTSRYGVRGLAARGADFADTIRDPDVWRKTREGALVAGGWTVGLIRDLGAAFAKKKLEELTGLKL